LKACFFPRSYFSAKNKAIIAYEASFRCHNFIPIEEPDCFLVHAVLIYTLLLLQAVFLMLRAPSPFLLQLGYERFLVFCNPLLHFLPNSRTILVFDAYDCVNHFVNSTFVSFSDFYSRFFEDSLKMSEVAGHINSPQQMDEMREV
jgi:hypothetical protein